MLEDIMDMYNGTITIFSTVLLYLFQIKVRQIVGKLTNVMKKGDPTIPDPIFLFGSVKDWFLLLFTSACRPPMNCHFATLLARNHPLPIWPLQIWQPTSSATSFQSPHTSWLFLSTGFCTKHAKRRVLQPDFAT